ncbi:hypothetical protein U4I65_08505 [Stenotrophomonas maltophilia]|uniref:hypothetical protein n=1 Tax=Stenotrophomonas maltophilia TaxID=40324 RepID=UPI002ACC8E89|nr:hypothetical protein [Stenotrophomonas maltophilia]MDZ5815072.1 hypothetical protein [Stenotrophomonas maltophilia]
MSRPGSNGPAPGNRPAPPPNPPALSLNTSQGGRRFIAEFFATELGRHDFTAYISTHLAADFACALAQHLAATGKRQVDEVQGDGLEPPPYILDAGGMCALESFLVVAEEFRRSAEPYIESINEGGDAAEDEISEVFDGLLNTAKGAVARFRPLTARQPVVQQRVKWFEVRGLAAGIVKNLNSFATSQHKTAWCGLLDDSLLFADQIQKQASTICTAAAAPGIDPGPRPMDTAPRDGTLVRLLVDFDENAIDDSIGATWTIGACNDDNVSEGARIGWQFAGWCWTHDHFTDGKGTPVGWLPLIDGPRDAAPAVTSAEPVTLATVKPPSDLRTKLREDGLP